MFDIVATNAVTITAFDAHPKGDTTIEIYYKSGSHDGSEATSTDWTLIGSTAVVAESTGTATKIPLDLSISIPAGETYAFYITSTNAEVSLNYTDGTTLGAVYASDENIQFLEGKGVEYPFGTTYSPRIFNGNLYYKLTGTEFLWSNGETTDSITVDTSDDYTVTATLNSCVSESAPITVTINDAIDNTVSNVADVLTANQAGATYQWYECPSTLITGETNQSFTPTGVGSYTVAITSGICTEYSDCITVSTLGVDDFAFSSNLSISPNPSYGVFNIQINSNATIELFNLLGKKLQSYKINSGNHSLDLSQYNAGIYLVKVSNESNQSKTVKLIKQ
jgi:hypothetical protein